MLINFTFENFRSFESITTFTMVPGPVEKHSESLIDLGGLNKKVVNYSSIYGANASGKSNFVSAIKWSKRFITHKNESKFKWNSMFSGSESNDSITRFEYDIQLKEKTFSYGFDINSKKRVVENEWLYDLTGEETVIYTKKNNEHVIFNENIFENNESVLNRLEVYIEDYGVESSSLFLTELNKGKQVISIDKYEDLFKRLYNWFDYTLEVITPNSSTRDFGAYMVSDKVKNQLAHFLKANSTGVEELQLHQVEEDDIDDFPKELLNLIKENLIEDKDFKKSSLLKSRSNIYKLALNKAKDDIIIEEVIFVHDSGKKLSYKNESDGTKRLIDLFSILISNDEKVYVVDEIDRSLHPILTYNFVKEFIEKSKNSQLIVTTHEDRILDLNLVRRDQIWFIEKNNKGQSHLYSLEQYKTRFDTDIKKAYYNGRYGAIPQLGDFKNILYPFTVREDE